MNVECAREQDVFDALAAQRWPAKCDAELQQHVHGCATCADLVEVARALLEDHDRAHEHARVPPSGLVWWRAQLRAREEDARAAARPIAFIQGVAVSVAAWLTVTLIRAIPSTTIASWKRWLVESMPHPTLPRLADLAAAVPLSLILGVGAALLVIPLAIYFAFAEE
jgi:hypothetical protein